MSKLARPPFEAQLSGRSRAFLERAAAGEQQLEPPPPGAPPDSAPSSMDGTRAERRTRRRLERRRARPRPPATPERLQRRRQRDEQYLQRLRRRLKERGCHLPPSLGIRGIPRSAWVMARDILADRSGQAARVWLRRCRDHAFVGAVRVAALVPFADGSARYTWADERARRVAALGLFVHSLSIPTRRRGAWNGLVRGVPRGALCAALQDPYSGRRPSLTALSGRHRPGGCLEDGQVGYLRALELAGALYRQQLPAEACEAFERIGPSGYATNRYWVLSGALTAVADDELRAALMQLASAAWTAVHERPRRSDHRAELAADSPLQRATAPP